jgi:protein ImuB
LPRGGVARRFGADLLDALDRAYGLKPEIYPWLTLPEVFEAKLELNAQVETAPALMFGAQRLLKQLQIWLQLRHHGVLALELGWTMDARRNTASHGELLLRTAQATQDINHLQRLLAENLARLTLPAPVLYLHLRTVQTQALEGASGNLLLEDIQKGDDLHQMIERLSARLGAGNVLQLQSRADHRPELMQAWQPVSAAGQNGNQNATQLIAVYACQTGIVAIKSSKNAAVTQAPDSKPATATSSKNGRLKSHATARSGPQAGLASDALYPTWLLHQPLKLAVQNNTPIYQGSLTLLAGPQRLEAGWWGAVAGWGGWGGGGGGWGEIGPPPALRDYYIARSGQTGLLWIYRERLGGQGRAGAKAGAGPDWYLHGLFD